MSKILESWAIYGCDMVVHGRDRGFSLAARGVVLVESIRKAS